MQRGFSDNSSYLEVSDVMDPHVIHNCWVPFFFPLLTAHSLSLLIKLTTLNILKHYEINNQFQVYYLSALSKFLTCQLNFHITSQSQNKQTNKQINPNKNNGNTIHHTPQFYTLLLCFQCSSDFSPKGSTHLCF